MDVIMVQGKIGKEGGRVRVISEKKYPADWFWGEKLTRKNWGREYPALKKTLAPLYVGETIISLAISRGLEKKHSYPNQITYTPLKSQILDSLKIFNARRKSLKKIELFPLWNYVCLFNLLYVE